MAWQFTPFAFIYLVTALVAVCVAWLARKRRSTPGAKALAGLMVAALAAIVLAHGESLRKRETQAERARRKTLEFAETGKDPGPLPGPGVYARHNSIEYPALLPDGSIAEKSVSPTLAIRGTT